jgi:hypothetical protein
VVIRRILLLACAIGLAIGLLSHIFALIRPGTPFPRSLLPLFLGIPVLAIPAFLVCRKLDPTYSVSGARQVWQFIFSRCPSWAPWALHLLFGYAAIHLLLSIAADFRAGDHTPLTLLFGSAGSIPWYFALGCIFYGGIQPVSRTA